MSAVLVIYLAVVLPPFFWLLGALYVMLFRETREWWSGARKSREQREAFKLWEANRGT